MRDFEMNRVELSVDTLPVDETIEETEQKEQKGIALDPPVVPEEEDCADDTVYGTDPFHGLSEREF